MPYPKTLKEAFECHVPELNDGCQPWQGNGPAMGDREPKRIPSFETPLGEPTRVRPADLPEEAVQAAARAMVTIYQGFQADGATSLDEEAARAALEAAAPILAAQVRRDLLAAARACTWCGEIHERNPDDHAYFMASQEGAAWLARQIGESR